MSYRSIAPFAAFLLAAAAGGCSPQVDVRGNMADRTAMEEIVPGVSTREDVQELLGSPSSVSTFEDNTWYYVGQRIERLMFFKPEVTERRVLVVSFGPEGRVADKRVLSEADGQEIEMVERTTPTEGREITILQQLLGNIGRFPTEGQ